MTRTLETKISQLGLFSLNSQEGKKFSLDRRSIPPAENDPATSP